jgi:hypothetical protein
MLREKGCMDASYISEADIMPYGSEQGSEQIKKWLVKCDM